MKKQLFDRFLHCVQRYRRHHTSADAFRPSASGDYHTTFPALFAYPPHSGSVNPVPILEEPRFLAKIMPSPRKRANQAACCPKTRQESRPGIISQARSQRARTDVKIAPLGRPRQALSILASFI